MKKDYNYMVWFRKQQKSCEFKLVTLKNSNMSKSVKVKRNFNNMDQRNWDNKAKIWIVKTGD